MEGGPQSDSGARSRAQPTRGQWPAHAQEAPGAHPYAGALALDPQRAGSPAGDGQWGEVKPTGTGRDPERGLSRLEGSFLNGGQGGSRGNTEV